MKASIGFHLRGLTLFLWAGVLLAFTFSGRLPAYLHPSFRPYVPLAGFVLILLAFAYYFFKEDRDGESGTDEACGGGGCCGHGDQLTAGKVLAFLVVALPLITAKLVSQDEFSAVTMLNRWSIQSSLPPIPASERQLAPLPGMDDEETGQNSDASSYLVFDEQGRILAEVIDLMFGIEDEGIRHDFEGREVVLVGQYMPAEANSSEGKRFRLARMFMWCCAADARPLSILVEGETDASPGQWVRVTGKAAFPEEGGGRIALVREATVEPTTAPAEPLLY